MWLEEGCYHEIVTLPWRDDTVRSPMNRVLNKLNIFQKNLNGLVRILLEI